jgi:hypothetical protein
MPRGVNRDQTSMRRQWASPASAAPFGHTPSGIGRRTWPAGRKSDGPTPDGPTRGRVRRRLWAKPLRHTAAEQSLSNRDERSPANTLVKSCHEGPWGRSWNGPPLFTGTKEGVEQRTQDIAACCPRALTSTLGWYQRGPADRPPAGAPMTNGMRAANDGIPCPVPV